MDTLYELYDWFIAHGGQMSRSLELAQGVSHGYYIRVRKDSEPIAPKACIINCPYSLTLSYLNATNTHPFPCHGDSFPKPFFGAVDRHTVTVFFLMLQYLKREDSFWWPYIRTLPQPDEADKFGTPFWFSEEDRLWLLGTDLEDSSQTRIAMWKSDWERAVQTLRRLDWPVEAYTWELAKWAITILSSRSFLSELLETATSEPGLLYWSQTVEANPSFPVLFPLSDLINHQPEAKMTWGKEDTHMSFILEENVLPGKPIWNNYGPKSNQQLLMGYGFSVRNNPNDSYLLRIGIHEKGPLASTRRRQRELFGNDYFSMQAEGRDVYTLYSPTRSYCKGYQHTIPEFRAFPQAMLDDISILVASPRELNTIRFSEKGFRLSGVGTYSRNDFSVMSHVLRTLRLRRRKILRNDSNLPPWPQNDRQFYAARYRRGQLHILTEIITSLEQRLNKALTSQSDGPLSELLDLRKILHRTPNPLRARFQAGLDAAFGTHKPSLLKDAGWEDAVMALWVSALWIAFIARGEKIQDRLGISQKLTRWITYMSEQYSRDESDPDSVVAASTDTRYSANQEGNGMVQGDGEGEVPSLPTNADVEDENQQRLIHYTEEIVNTVKAAAERDPQCLFAHPLWGGDLVGWGLRIVNGEAVNVPARDEGPESSDRLALFLEQREHGPDGVGEHGG